MMTSHLCFLFRQFHVVKDSEDDFKQIHPPSLQESVPVALHYLKHHRQTSEGGGGGGGKEGGGGGE